MKAGIFDPYLDTIGGGERYCLALAEWLALQGWQVEVFWPKKGIKKKICEKLNLNLKRVNFVPKRIDSKKNLLKRWQKGRDYDLLFFVSDGGIPLMFGRKNILHFQVPFKNVNGKGCWNQIKLKKIQHIVCNSFFTKKFIDKKFGINSQVIYPPVAIKEFKPGKKEKIILSVGRFSQLMQAKRQDILIHEFKRMIESDESELLSGWKLILAGGAEVGGTEFLRELKKMAQGAPIEIVVNPSFPDLQFLYGKAKIFWSATGFGFDEKKYPEKTEHFGITTVEAMAAGCVPVVIKKGGQKEIIQDGKSGFLWRTRKELIVLTLQLIKQEEQRKKISLQSIKQSKKFAKEVFCKKFEKLISE